jgi:hypothetical protein
VGAVALQESYALSGIPEYLRVLAKPVVDVILSGANPDTYPRERMLPLGAGLLRRDIDDIKSSLGHCHCTKKPFGLSEPYAALSANLSADVSTETRRQLTHRTQEGLLLRDLVAVQRELGRCTCTGRPSAA